MKKKQFIAITAAVVLLAACGSNNGTAAEGSAQSGAVQQAEVPPEQDTANAGDMEEAQEAAGTGSAETDGITMGESENAGVTYDYEVLDDGTANVYGYLADPVPETIEIPSEVDGHAVSSIERLFTNEDEVRKVVLPDSLTVIGKESFLFAASVEEVEIRGTVTELGENAFYGCDALKKLDFKEGLVRLADPSIFLCKSLEELHLPASLAYTAEEFTYKVDYFSSPSLTIYTPAGSAAEAFAKAYGVKVVNVGEGQAADAQQSVQPEQQSGSREKTDEVTAQSGPFRVTADQFDVRLGGSALDITGTGGTIGEFASGSGYALEPDGVYPFEEVTAASSAVLRDGNYSISLGITNRTGRDKVPAAECHVYSGEESWNGPDREYRLSINGIAVGEKEDYTWQDALDVLIPGIGEPEREVHQEDGYGNVETRYYYGDGSSENGMVEVTAFENSWLINVDLADSDRSIGVYYVAYDFSDMTGVETVWFG